MKYMKILLYTALAFPAAAHAQSFRIYKGDTINVTDKKGLKQGMWKRYYESDTLFTVTEYRNGKPVGVTRTYYPTGKLKAEVRHSKDGRRSVMTGYHENDTVMVTGFYLDMKKDSAWNFYDETGRITSSESYKAGREDGVWKIFYTNGRVAEETPWKNGKRQGPCRKYFEDGKLKFEATYHNDTFDGTCRMYHPNGKIWFTGEYINGLQEGTWIFNNEQGVRDSVQVFKKGLEVLPDK